LQRKEIVPVTEQGGKALLCPPRSPKRISWPGTGVLIRKEEKGKTQLCVESQGGPGSPNRKGRQALKPEAEWNRDKGGREGY